MKIPEITAKEIFGDSSMCLHKARLPGCTPNGISEQNFSQFLVEFYLLCEDSLTVMLRD